MQDRIANKQRLLNRVPALMWQGVELLRGDATPPVALVKPIGSAKSSIR